MTLKRTGQNNKLNSINSFKNNLDKFWQNEDVKFNWKANLTGAGSRSLSLT